MRNYFSHKGFTMIETMVTIGLFILLMAGIAVLFKTIYADSIGQQLTIDTIDQARSIIYTFGNEIRNATRGIDGSYPVTQADASQIVFFTTSGSNTTVANRIRYFVAGDTLYKGKTIPSGSPLLYVPETEVVTPVFVGLASGTSTIFSYYNGSYSGTSSPLTDPVNVNDVKYVSMSLTAWKREPGFAATSTFSISAGATIRNLKTNLGN